MLISQSRDEISLSIFAKKMFSLVNVLLCDQKMNFDLKIAD